MLKEEGPKEWIYKENLEVSSNTFRFLSKSRPQGYACSLAEKLQNYASEDVLSGPYLTTSYDPGLIAKILGYLRADNMIISITAREFKGKTERTEKWYGTEYNDVPLDAEKVRSLRDELRSEAQSAELRPRNELDGLRLLYRSKRPRYLRINQLHS